MKTYTQNDLQIFHTAAAAWLWSQLIIPEAVEVDGKKEFFDLFAWQFELFFSSLTADAGPRICDRNDLQAAHAWATQWSLNQLVQKGQLKKDDLIVLQNLDARHFVQFANALLDGSATCKVEY